MEKRFNVKTISEIGITIALLIILLFISTYIPILDLITTLIVPLPIIVITVRNNTLSGIITAILGLIISCTILGVVISIPYFIYYFIVGITMGICIKNKIKPIKTVMFTAISVILSLVLSILLGMYVFNNLNIVDIINEMINSIKQSFNVYEELGVSLKDNPSYEAIMNITVEDILTMVPSILIFYGALISYILYNVSSIILNRININCDKLPSFSDWYIDIKTGVILVLIICIAMIINSKNIMYSEYILITAFNMFFITMVISGVAIVYGYLIKKINMDKTWAACICILISIITSGMLPSMLGVIDLFLDFRHKDENSMGSIIRRICKEK